MDAANNNASAGGVVVGKDKKIVLVFQHGNSWSLPKGHIEDGETLLQAARREIYEEAGLEQLQLVKELGSFERYSIGPGGAGENRDWSSRRRTFFLFTTDEETLESHTREVTEARWVTLDEALSLLTHPKDREFLQTIRTEVEAL